MFCCWIDILFIILRSFYYVYMYMHKFTHLQMVGKMCEDLEYIWKHTVFLGFSISVIIILETANVFFK